MRIKACLLILTILLLTAVPACNFNVATANLSQLRLGKNRAAEPARGTFAPDDKVFAVSRTNNTGGKNRIRYRLLFEDVKGAESGTVAYNLEKELVVEGSREFRLVFSVPSGFAPGRYRIEAVLLDEYGDTELDREAAVFTVRGGQFADPDQTGEKK